MEVRADTPIPDWRVCLALCSLPQCKRGADTQIHAVDSVVVLPQPQHMPADPVL
jgi:hypothetical protein